MGETKTKNVTWERWRLDTPQDMCECLIELVNRGYRGEVRCGPNPSGDLVWLIEIGQESPYPPVCGNIGYVFILLGTRLECLSLEDYKQVYGDWDAS